MRALELLIFALLVFVCRLAWSFEAPHGVRSPRALLMGDAWTAVANDDFTLFYNPAALGRHHRDFTFTPFNPTISGTNPLGDFDRFEDFPEDPVGIADRVMNYPVHVSTGIAPGLKLFNFGFNLIAQGQADLLLRNKIHPMLDVDIRYDRGFVTGVGVPLGSSRLKGNSIMGSQTTLGFGVKYIRRQGLQDSLALTGSDILDHLGGGGELADIQDMLGVVEGQSWGYDLGLEHVVRSGPQQVVLAVAVLDALGTEFDVPKNDDGKRVAKNEQQVNLGAAWMYRTALLRSTFSLDVRQLTQEMEMMERVRFGAEIGAMGFSALAGFNAGYLSYGAAIDVGLFKMTAGFYGVEVGGGYRRVQSKRFVIYLSLFDFSFDA